MSKLLNFKNSGMAKPFEIRNKSATKAEIIIYDQIGADWFSEGVTAKAFSEALSKLDKAVKDIDVRINSPGGDVFEGIAIYNRLKQHPAKVRVYIDGLAASIASVIAMAGDEIIMGDGALFMIHLPWTITGGNRMELENTINRLIDCEEQLLTIYKKRSPTDKNTLRQMLEEETWLDADQAIEHGFVDKKSEDDVAIAASAMDKKWIKSAPRNFNSQTKVAKSEALKLKQKIEERLRARK